LACTGGGGTGCGPERRGIGIRHAPSCAGAEEAVSEEEAALMFYKYILIIMDSKGRGTLNTVEKSFKRLWLK
jgi:hypothetical protein